MKNERTTEGVGQQKFSNPSFLSNVLHNRGRARKYSSVFYFCVLNFNHTRMTCKLIGVDNYHNWSNFSLLLQLSICSSTDIYINYQSWNDLQTQNMTKYKRNMYRNWLNISVQSIIRLTRVLIYWFSSVQLPNCTSSRINYYILVNFLSSNYTWSIPSEWPVWTSWSRQKSLSFIDEVLKNI